ncbi:MAG TPA: hypothetical protein VNU46_05255, partial [Gemmatimonadaceae bacterium]|nr:hypothetical protein [Gemmatimonadaceae bacterium]
MLNMLARQAHLQPIIKYSPILTNRINVHLVDAAIMDAFATVLQGTGLVATRTPGGDIVVVHPVAKGGVSTGTSHLAFGAIVGRVTDSASGQGLGGASVKVEGTKLSTVTSDSGHFTLKDV